MRKEDDSTHAQEFSELMIGDIQGAAITRPANPLSPWENADQVIFGTDGLIGVLDGAGKANPASSIAKGQFLSKFVRKPRSTLHAERGLLMGFSSAMEEVQKAEEDEGPYSLQGDHYMTTATIAQIYEIGGVRFISGLHLGDSRLIGMRRNGNIFRTADQSKVYQDLQANKITTAQALVFQHYIDEIVDPQDLERYVSIFGEDLGIPESMEESEIWRGNGGLPIREFVNERKVLGNAIKTKGQYRVTSFPDCFTFPIDEFYAIGIMTDGFTDNIRTSEIIKNLEMLQMPHIRPGSVVMKLDGLAQDSQYPKRNIDDRSMVLLKI